MAYHGGKLQAELHRYFLKHPDEVFKITKKLADMAAKGDMKAQQMIWDRESGKVQDTIVHSFQTSYLNEVMPPEQLSDQIIKLEGTILEGSVKVIKNDVEDCEEIVLDSTD